jgi:hypothetical protein
MCEIATEQPIALKIDYSSKSFLDLHKTFPVFSLTLSKWCCSCKNMRPAERFSPDKRGKYGVGSTCKDCTSLKNSKEWYAKHPRKPIPKEGFKFCSKCGVEKPILEYQLNTKSPDGHRPSCKECDAKTNKIKSSRLETKTKRKKRQAERVSTDVQFKLAKNLRSRMGTAIKRVFKAGSAVRDCGCSMEFLRNYLEAKFLPGMAWENWGVKGWHIDHIIPLDAFDLTNREQFLTACHYTNLQPLWWQENLSKGSNL